MIKIIRKLASIVVAAKPRIYPKRAKFLVEEKNMSKKKLGILVGSLRCDSYIKKIAQYLSGLLEEQFDDSLLKKVFTLSKN